MAAASAWLPACTACTTTSVTCERGMTRWTHWSFRSRQQAQEERFSDVHSRACLAVPAQHSILGCTDLQNLYFFTGQPPLRTWAHPSIKNAIKFHFLPLGLVRGVNQQKVYCFCQSWETASCVCIRACLCRWQPLCTVKAPQAEPHQGAVTRDRGMGKPCNCLLLLNRRAM